MEEKKARVREELDAFIKRCEAILHGDEAEGTSSAADTAPSPQGEDSEGMTAEREGRILEAAIGKFGREAQVAKAIEEMSELTQVLAKDLLRTTYGLGNEAIPDDVSDEDLGDWISNYSARLNDHILEELADVIIMTKQLELIYGDTTDWEIQKLERLERMVQG